MPLRYKCFLALLVVLTGCQSTQNLLGRCALTSNERSGNAEESPPKTETAGLPQPTDADPPQTSSPALSTAEDHLRLGEKVLEQNRYAQVQEHFEQALRQDPALARRIIDWPSSPTSSSNLTRPNGTTSPPSKWTVATPPSSVISGSPTGCRSALPGKRAFPQTGPACRSRLPESDRQPRPGVWHNRSTR